MESISVKEGETVNVGALLGKITGSVNQTTDIEKNLKSYSPPKKKISPQKRSAEPPKNFEEDEKPLQLNIEEVKNEKEEEPLILEDVHEEIKVRKNKNTNIQKPSVSPAARKIVTEAKININNIQGTGKNGVILKEDVMSLMGAKPSPSERRVKFGPEERIKMTRLRLTIAKRLKEAQESAAMLTTFNEVDMSEVISMRNQYKEEFQSKYNVKLGFMSFFVKACVIGLKTFQQ